MSKYLFYAAFLYFCWYAGNKAFPPTIQQAKSDITNVQNQVSSGNASSVPEKEMNLDTRVLLNSSSEKHDLPGSTVLPKEHRFLYFNTSITSSHNLFIQPAYKFVEQVNFKQPGSARNDDGPQLIVLNK